MTSDSLSDSCILQSQHSFNLNLNPINQEQLRYSARSNRRDKVSSIVLNKLIDFQKPNPLKLDRLTYKLRIKSDLNVDLLQETHRHKREHTNSPVSQTSNSIPPTTRRKTFIRQRSASSKTTTTTTKENNQLNGIEGNAVRVETIKDLIKQCHREETRLIHDPNQLLSSPTLTTIRRIQERPPPFLMRSTIKKPQALTEYHFDLPNQTMNRSRLKEKNNLPILIDQYSTKHRSTVMNSHTKRIQESRQKILHHTEKQPWTCNKLTIIDPYNSEDNPSILPSTRYIFPAIRPFGYLIRKSMDDLPNTIPTNTKKKQLAKDKQLEVSLDSLDRLSIETESSSQVLDDKNQSKSLATLVDSEDDLDNPPNTIINGNFKP